MGLYNFQPRFAPRIRAWAASPDAPDAKGHTIRAPRKGGREDKPGNTMYLYTGLRTKAAKRIIAPVTCAKVESVVFREDAWSGPRFDERGTHVRVFVGPFIYLSKLECARENIIARPVDFDLHELDPAECDQLARRDGFTDFADMMAFWGTRTPDGKKSRLPFYGHIFHWAAMPTVTVSARKPLTPKTRKALQDVADAARRYYFDKLNGPERQIVDAAYKKTKKGGR